MEVPAEILAQLKCHKCELYLSRGPVYLEHGGAAACGRCFSPKRSATRNKEYEAVAKLLRFPCKNRDLGCGETVGFEEVAHEVTCSYRQYVCPVLGSSRCEWLGTRSQLLQHCQEQHPDHVLDNPCSLTHDIATSSLHNYLLQAFQLLFLVLTKVCVTSGRIYHSVRLLDSDDMAQDFSYKLHVRRGDEKLTKRGDVAPQGCLALQEPTALGLDVNGLLSVLGGWGGVTFTVAVKRRGRQQEIVVQEEQQETVAVEEPEPVEEQEECFWCGEEVTVKLYRDECGWRCEHCAPTMQVCGFIKGRGSRCTHQDIPNKCGKHSLYFCQQRTWCWICKKNVSRSTLSTHYTSRHRDVTHSSGSTWRATETDGRHCIVTCPAGTAVCGYSMDGSGLYLCVYMPVLSERLCEFRCEISVTQVCTGLTHTYTPDITYKDQWDWRIHIYKDFPSYTCDFDISVNICELQN